jgi:hypothetical protein
MDLPPVVFDVDIDITASREVCFESGLRRKNAFENAR